MANNEAIQALKLGFSYQDDVLEQLDNGNVRGNYELSSKLIRDLKSSLKNIEKAESIDPKAELDDGRGIIAGKALSIGFMGCIEFEGHEEREKAIKLLKEALDLHDEIALFHAELGMIYANQGKKQLAVDHLKQAIELEPENMEYRKRLDKLEDCSESALKTRAFKGNPIALLVWFGLAIILLIAGFNTSDPIGLIGGIICGGIGFLYWKAKSKS